MTKELEVFSKERQALDELYDVAGNIKNLKEDYIILKTALNRLEAIDNAKPSEALECLKHIKKYYIPEPCSTKTYDCLETIKQALLNNRKENNILKVLKPLCKVKETPEKTVRYLLVSGTVVYVFKEIEEYEMFKEWLKDE